jgi:hypothetical protein
MDTINIIKLEKNNWGEYERQMRLILKDYGIVGKAILKGTPIVRAEEPADVKKDIITDEYDSAEMTIWRDKRKKFIDTNYEIDKHQPKLMGTLIRSCSTKFQTELMNDPKFMSYFEDDQVSEMWSLMKSLSCANGPAQIGLEKLKFGQLSQTGALALFIDYHREFNRTCDNLKYLKAEVNDQDQVVRFIAGVNKTQFRVPYQSFMLANKWDDAPAVIAAFVNYNNNVEALSKLESLQVKPNYNNRFESRNDSSNANGVQANATVSVSRTTSTTNPCSNCEQFGHYSRFCTSPRAVCEICQKNHLTKLCYRLKERETNQQVSTTNANNQSGKLMNRPVPKNQPTSNQAKPNQQQNNSSYYMSISEEDEEDDLNANIIVVEEVKENVVLSATLQPLATHVQGDEKHDRLYLDSCCTGGSIVKNIEYLTNTLKCDLKMSSVVHEDNINCQQGTLPAVGKAYFIPNALKSLLSLSEMEKHGWTYAVCEGRMKLKRGELIVTAKRDKTNQMYYLTIDDLQAAEWTQRQINHAHYVVGTVVVGGERVFSTVARQRARDALELHANMGHPNDKYLCQMLNNGNMQGCNLTSQDLRNARIIHGECIPCIQAKMRASAAVTSMNEKASVPGQRVHLDYKEFPRPTLGGNLGCNMAIDEASGMGFCLVSKGKDTHYQIESMQHLIDYMLTHHHVVKEFCCDNEIQYTACRPAWAEKGIKLTQTISGMHEKTAERFIQSIMGRSRAALMDLNYDPPAKLAGELRVATVFKWNLCVNKASYPLTPIEIVEGIKPRIPMCGWGTPGLFHDTQLIGGDTHERAEMGIVVGYNNDQRQNLRVYMPSTGRLRNRGKFIRINNIPMEWGWPTRIKIKSMALPMMDMRDLDDVVPIMENGGVVGGRPPDVALQDENDQIINVQNILPPTEEVRGVTNNIEYGIRGNVEPRERMIVPDIEANDATHFVSPSNHNDQSITVHPYNPTSTSSSELCDPTSSSSNTFTSTSSSSPLNHTSSSSSTSSDFTFEDLITGDHESMNDITRRSGRLTRRPEYLKEYLSNSLIEIYSNNQLQVMSVVIGSTQLLVEERSKVAFKSEFDALFHQQVLEPVDPLQITNEILKCALPIQVLEVDKYDANGVFEKRKARACLGGHKEDPNSYGDTRSPTINPMAIMTMINIATIKDEEMAAYDAVRAFLNTPVDDNTYIWASLSPNMSGRVIEIYPHLKIKKSTNGKLYFRVKKYLYGLHEASKKFGDWLGNIFLRIGFKKSVFAEAAYIKLHSDGTQSRIGVHVDDMLGTFPSLQKQKEFEKLFGNECEYTKKNEEFSFLGMSIKRDRSKKLTTISQQGYTMDLLKKFGMENANGIDTPMALPSQSKEELKSGIKKKEVNKSDYLSIVMSLMYLARFTRPDLLFAVTNLSTKTSDPNEDDMTNAKRVLRYIRSTPNYGLIFCDANGSNIKLTCWVDAGHATHADGKGHGGIVITLGSAPILYKSYKLKHVTLSSTESEISALSEAITYIIWARMLLDEFGYTQEAPTVVNQDNMSAIMMNNQGGGSFRKSKHLLVRKSFIEEFIREQFVHLQFCPTEKMVADIFTKATTRAVMEKLLNKMQVKEI